MVGARITRAPAVFDRRFLSDVTPPAMPANTPALPITLREVWRLASATILSITAFAMLLPSLSVVLDRAGYSAQQVGVFALAPFLAILILSPLVPPVRRRIGLIPAYRLGMILSGLNILGFAMSLSLPDVPTRYGVWVALNVLGGVSGAFRWGINESLIAQTTPGDRMGRVTGLYQTLVGAAFAVGPFLPQVLHLTLAQTFWLAVVCELLAWVPTWPLHVRPYALPPSAHHFHDHEAPDPLSWWRAVKAAPLLPLMAWVGGVFEAGLPAAGVIELLHAGLIEDLAKMMPGVIAVGSLLAQFPAGWLSDHVTELRLLSGCLLGLGISLGLLPLLHQGYGWSVWPLGLVWGALGGVLYTLAMIRTGRLFRGEDTATGASVVIAFYTLGAVVGPWAGGVAQDVSHRWGLLTFLSATVVVGGVGLCLLPKATRPIDDQR